MAPNLFEPDKTAGAVVRVRRNAPAEERSTVGLLDYRRQIAEIIHCTMATTGTHAVLRAEVGSGKTYAAIDAAINICEQRTGQTTKCVFIAPTKEHAKRLRIQLRAKIQERNSRLKVGEPPTLDGCAKPEILAHGRHYGIQDYACRKCPLIRNCEKRRAVAAFQESPPDIVVCTRAYFEAVAGHHDWTTAKLIIADEDAEKLYCQSSFVEESDLISATRCLREFCENYRPEDPITRLTDNWAEYLIGEITEQSVSPRELDTGRRMYQKNARDLKKDGAKPFDWFNFSRFAAEKGLRENAVEIVIGLMARQNKVRSINFVTLKKYVAKVHTPTRYMHVVREAPVTPDQTVLMLDATADAQTLAHYGVADVTPSTTLAPCHEAIQIYASIRNRTEHEKVVKFFRALCVRYPGECLNVIGHKKHIQHLEAIRDSDPLIQNVLGLTAWFGGDVTGANWHEETTGRCVVLGDYRANGQPSLVQAALTAGFSPEQIEAARWSRKCEYVVSGIDGSEYIAPHSNYLDHELAEFNRKLVGRHKIQGDRGRHRLPDGMPLIYVGTIPEPGVPWHPEPLSFASSDIQQDLLTIFEQADGPLKNAELVEQLRAEGHDVKTGSKRLRNALNSLRKLKIIVMVGKKYRRAINTHTNTVPGQPEQKMRPRSKVSMRERAHSDTQYRYIRSDIEVG